MKLWNGAPSFLDRAVFLGAVIVVTLASFAAVVLLWPSLARRRPAKILARAGMLPTVNVLVLLTAATQLNAQFLFLADWTDLRGAFGRSPTSTSLSCAAFLKAAKPPLAVEATVLQHAGHRVSLWQGLLPGSLTWLGTNVPGFRATP